MKLYFADIDGIYNTPQLNRNQNDQGVDVGLLENAVMDEKLDLMRERVLPYHPNLKTVITSSWRYQTRLSVFKDVFDDFNVIDKLPVAEKSRGQIIQEYIDNMDQKVDNYVVVDDVWNLVSEIEYGKLVLVNGEKGLIERDCEKINYVLDGEE
jgi:hypothetical protein